MRRSSIIRLASLAMMGGMVFQVAGCTSTETLIFIQTVFLGVTAAGAVAILQNL
jgi:hypothetical protein